MRKDAKHRDSGHEDDGNPQVAGSLYIILAAAVLAIAAAGIILGKTGLITMLFWWVLYILPAYIILASLGLDPAESFVISMFATAGIIPALVFFLNYVLPSLKYSAIVVFAVEAAVAGFMVFKRGKPGK